MKHADGIDSMYAFQLAPAVSSESAMFVADTQHVVQSELMP